jgi:hypothetical protein
MPSNTFIGNNDNYLQEFINYLNRNKNSNSNSNSNPISNPNNPVYNVVITSYSGPTRTSSFR